LAPFLFGLGMHKETVMYKTDVQRMADASVNKVAYLEQSLLGYVILAALAGVYLGFGITLIFSIGAPFAAEGSAALKLVMGVSFGIALTLVIFAGSELFTGNNMVGVLGALSRHVTWSQVSALFVWSLAGNMLGSLAVAWLVAQSGVVSAVPQATLIQKVAQIKMSLPAWELFLRGILCNWLVCLAVWTSARALGDAAKLLLIFWCLFAFVGSGFEHSIANQSLLGLALFLPHDAAISWAGFVWNQTWVILGNIVGGGVFVGGLYWMASPVRRVHVTDVPRTEQTPVMVRREPLP
jgi:nitrite transporter